MKLKDFIDHKSNCPICNKQLVPIFISKSRKIVDLNDNWYQVTFDLGFKKNTYKVLWSLNKHDNTFFVDFCNKDFKILDAVPVTLINSFLSSLDNIKNSSFQMYNTCNSCKKYHYTSNKLNFDFKNKLLEDLSIYLELVNLSEPFQDGYKHFKLINNYLENKSELFYAKSKHENLPRWEILNPKIKTSLIKLSDDVFDKLNKIILFS